ncbi:MAG: DUF389 domain-containing protein [Bacteroidales bacterium]|nr:DUF389 domain-containing protein [Bacteroidales bacterium]
MNLRDFPKVMSRYLRRLADLREHVDTEAAARQIQNGIWFKGPNVWILAFSILIASVGLNVNSTAVIIGAMLVSPLMGPIIGIGLSLGTDDMELLKNAAKNLLVMVVISLLVSSLYFLISPLRQNNPTELLARTSPTIYDVLIAFFGGCAGIIENARKEKGTVLSGVAIATALMPPLCTAGFGLAHLNFHHFFGAMYLFLINGIFITIATYIFVRSLHFKKHSEGDFVEDARRKNIISALLVAFIVPSIISAAVMIRDNNFEQQVDTFVRENRFVGKTYIYDYKIEKGRGRKVDLRIAGRPMSPAETRKFLDLAKSYGIKDTQIKMVEHSIGLTRDDLDAFASSLYNRLSQMIANRDTAIAGLHTQLDSLQALLQARDSSINSNDEEKNLLSDPSAALE